MRLGRRMRVFAGWMAGLTLAAGLARMAGAQADYPFRDPKMGEDQRIADLLGRLTVEEKISLMSDHPAIPRLGVAFSGQVEGLHGLALGGPGEWGAKGRQPLPTTTFPQEKGLGATWDPKLLKRIASLEGYEARYAYQNPIFSRGGVVVRAPNADLSRDPRWADRGVVQRGPVSGGNADRGLCAGLAGTRCEALAGRLADETLSGQ